MMRFPEFLLAMMLRTLATAQEPSAEVEPQFPQQQSANDLLRACASSSLTAVGRERRRYCAGFMSGVEESMRLVHRMGHLEVSVCPPERVTARALANAYISYASKHPGGAGKACGRDGVRGTSADLSLRPDPLETAATSACHGPTCLGVRRPHWRPVWSCGVSS